MEIQCHIDIREFELELALPIIPVRARVLEIGAGAGWQAKKLHEHGCEVEAIDIVENPGGVEQVWPVRQYDGANIPFPDAYFDVAFSSNVLEHVVNGVQLQSEIKRVLQPEGVAIHVLPTSSWRFWTNISYYLYAIELIYGVISGRIVMDAARSGNSTAQRELRINAKRRLHFLKKLFPKAHGEGGNFLSELYLFSRWRWIALFKKTGWRINYYFPTRLFYTGHLIAGSRFSISVRRLLSYILGSSCIIYVLKK